MSTKHTPGPWRLWGSADPSQVISAADCFVAQTVGGNDLANARLIAAAPELFAACAEFVRKCESGEAKSTRSYAQMKAAIAKATGEPA